MSKDPAFLFYPNDSVGGMGNLYLIKLWNREESFYKIGTTVNKYCRFYQLMKEGYECKIIYLLMKLDYFKVLNLESYYKDLYADLQYTPIKKFGGYTECFHNIDEEDYINRLRVLVPYNLPVIKNLEITWR